MKVAIIGGHLSPSLAVIAAKPSGIDVLFIGRKHALEGDQARSLEERVISEKGIPFHALTTGRLQRKLTRHTVVSLFKLPYGAVQAFSLLRKTKPDVILSFGGYISLPVVIAASIRNIPVVIHEQTLEAGLANKIAARFAAKICISWESSTPFFPREKTVLTGNPIRNFPFSNYHFPFKDKRTPVIYVTGGSAGSHAINVLLEGCIEKLLEEYTVLHQTGDAREFADYERLEQLRSQFSQEKKNRYILKKFVLPSEIGGILQTASLVVSRSGINTVSELLYFEKPALFVPLPFAQRGEQKKNALFLKQIGLAEVLDQSSATPERLYHMIEEMLGQPGRYRCSEEIDNLSDLLRHAALRIWEVVLDVYQQAGNKEAEK